MKLFKYYILPAFLFVIMIVSCTETFEVHKDYVDVEETLYSNKPLALEAFSGTNRIEIKGIILDAIDVVEIIIDWNDGDSQLAFPFEFVDSGSQ